MDYHEKVFNSIKREFVGDFEGMYKNETIDPWRSSNLTHLSKKIHSAVLGGRNWESILDFGCGEGVFTHTLKKTNNIVVGVDISQNAIDKANDTYGDIVNFFHISNKSWKNKYHLIVCLEVLSYIESYEKQLENFAKISEYIYIVIHPKQSNWVCKKYPRFNCRC